MISCISSITESAEHIIDEVAEAICKHNEIDFIMRCYRNFIVNKQLVGEFNTYLFKESFENGQMQHIPQLKSENPNDYHIPNN